MPNKLIKILSIDGGGVRGIIPITLLAELERFLPDNLPLCKAFDLISGTSIGGILSLLLIKPMPHVMNKPAYTALSISAMFVDMAKSIFKRSIFDLIKNMDGWIGNKYNGKNLTKELEYHFFENITGENSDHRFISNALCDFVIPTYDIESNKTIFLNKCLANSDPFYNLKFSELSRATSAAPTYFPPVDLTISPDYKRIFIDGGISANNPVLAAQSYARSIYGNDIDFLIVSLGTGTIFCSKNKKIIYEEMVSSGKLGWVDNILSLLMSASDDLPDDIITNNKTLLKDNYFRFQPSLEPDNFDIDNCSDKNMNKLKQIANKMIKDREYDLELIAQVLIKERK